MNALSKIDSHAPRVESMRAPIAYLFMIREGPTYSLGDLAPECELLSQRFVGEFWSYGSYESDTLIGRIRLRVVKDRSESRALNFLRFAGRVLRRAREARRTYTGPVVATS